MAKGTITITNFSEGGVGINITPNGKPNAAAVASGYVKVEQTSGFAVSGFDLYEVVFAPYGGVVSATNIVPDAIVAIAITDTTTEDEDEASE